MAHGTMNRNLRAVAGPRHETGAPAYRRGMRPPSASGLVGAAVVWAAGLGPSLLPRPPVIGIALAGLLGAVGYGLGCAVGAVSRAWLPKPTWWPPILWLLAGLAWLAAIVQTWFATEWQMEQSLDLGITPAAPRAWVLVIAGVALATGLVLVLGRGTRALSRVVARRLRPRIGRTWATVAGVAVPVMLTLAVLFSGYLATQAVFGRIDRSGAGVAAPASALRSGGPGSLVGYDSLGAEGQTFVTGGPGVESISSYSGKPALEPIRVYAGLGSAPTPEERAQLAVDELERTGAFTRKLVVVAVTTGNGYLDPALVSAPEYLMNGDVATVSAQYSVLPSWLSFLVDQRAAGDEARAMWQAVREAIDQLPPEQRPLLATSGESLGAFGGQAPFFGLDPEQVISQADAAVWVGSPAASALWPQWRDDRTAGPVWEPTIGDGRIARDPASLSSTQWDSSSWGQRRIVLTQHANDPVAWWSVPLLWQRPDWLDVPRGPGVDARVTWWPGVFFAQSGLDLAAAGSVPPGVGHNYGDVTGRAWAAALSTPGTGPGGAWTADDTTRLARALG